MGIVMKTIIALACLFLLLPVSTSFEADPLKTHEAGFGPEILGLQLGKHMAWTEMIDAEKKIHIARSEAEPPEMVTMPNGDLLQRKPILPPHIFGMTVANNYKALVETNPLSIPGQWITLHFFENSTVQIISHP